MYDLIISGINAKSFAKTIEHPHILVKDNAVRICHVNFPFSNGLIGSARAEGLDTNLVKSNLSIQDIRLIAFDMDCTLIEIDCIDHLAEQMGCGEVVSAMTVAAMQGEMDFHSHMRNSIRLLKGAGERELERTLRSASLAPGARSFIEFAQSHGVLTYIISGGLSQIAGPISRSLNMTGFISNELVIENKTLNGELIGPAGGVILDAPGKRRTLEILSMMHGIKLNQTLAVGDGANDLEMLDAAGIGVAYRAKPIVREKARHHVNHGTMEVIQDLFIESWEKAEKLTVA